MMKNMKNSKRIMKNNRKGLYEMDYEKKRIMNIIRKDYELFVPCYIGSDDSVR